MKDSIEYPRHREKVEWWFCHGTYQFATEPPTHFMITLFKVRNGLKEDDSVGHMLLISDLSRKQGSHTVTSIIDSGAQDVFLDYAEPLRQSNINSHLTEAYLDEIKKNGPPSPIVSRDTSPIYSPDGLNITWDDFHLSQQGNIFDIGCRLDEDKQCHFTLTSRHPRINLQNIEHPELNKFAYLSYPRLELSGTVAGKEVTGHAWFDHQFGNTEWFGFSKDEKVLGWDWLGINLNDGTDILFTRHIDIENNEELYNWIYVRSQTHPEGFFYNARLHTLRQWESPRTHITYPVELRLEVQDIGLSLDIHPIVDDQEIPVLGLGRAIWEGAGSVTGTFGDGPVTGDARIELTGYGYIVDARKYMDGFIERIDNHLEDFLPRALDTDWITTHIGAEHWKHDPQGVTEIIANPTWDFLSRNGKHWRPICALLIVESTGIDSGPYEQMISAITELNHSGSLIIDDIQDNSLIRRGEECMHLRYGVDVAINVGNSLYFLPYILLKNHPDLTDHQRLELYQLMAQVFNRGHFGQGLDLYWTNYLSSTKLETWLNDSFDQKLLQMYSYKTGASVEAVGEMACVLAGSDNETRKAYAALGRVFGVAFQLIDDVYNFNTSAGWTKVCGEDVIAGKPTFVIVTAMKMLDLASRERLITILCSKELREDNTYLKEAIDLVEQSGSLKYCRDKAEKMIEKEWDNFNRYAVHCDSKLMLRMLIAELLHYSYDY